MRFSRAGQKLWLFSLPSQLPDCLACHDRPGGAAFKFPTVERSVPGLGAGRILSVDPLQTRVDQGNVRVRTRGEGTFLEPEELGRIDCVHRDQVCQTDSFSL